MSCGCKTLDSEPISGLTTEKKKFSFKKDEINQNISNFLLRKNKFSFFGLILFLILLPTIIAFIFPIVTVILFNKLVLGKETDLIGLIAFKKQKKIKE